MSTQLYDLKRYILELDENLLNVTKMSNEQLSNVKAMDGNGCSVATILFRETSSAFMFSIGKTVSVEPDFNSSEVSVGEVLRKLSEVLEVEYFAYPAKYQTRGLTLGDISVRRLIWLPGDEAWEVVTNLQEDDVE